MDFVMKVYPAWNSFDWFRKDRETRGRFERFYFSIKTAEGSFGLSAAVFPVARQKQDTGPWEWLWSIKTEYFAQWKFYFLMSWKNKQNGRIGDFMVSRLPHVSPLFSVH